MKILVTQDFLTTSTNLGSLQVKALSSIVKVLQTIPGVNVEARALSRALFLNQVGIFDDDQKYIFGVTRSHLQDLKGLIDSTLKYYDFIIFYELTEITREALEQINIRYIDLWITPIRFYRDVFFELHSNCAYVNKILDKNKINESLLYERVQDIKNYSINFLPQPPINENSLLVITQLAEDKSVVKDGRFLALEDFFKDVKQLVEGYDHSYFLKHPKQSIQDFYTVFKPFESLKNVSIINKTSIYSLLSRDQLKGVTAISSSVLAECAYFRKRAIYLYKSVIPTYYFRVYEPVYSCSFWEEILGIESNNSSLALIVQDNDFRVSKNAVYGFKDFLNYDPVDLCSHFHHKSLVQLLIFIKNLNAMNRPVVIYGYGTLGKIILPLLENVSAIFDERSQDNSIVSKMNILCPSKENLEAFYNAIFLVTPYHSFVEISEGKLKGFEVVNLGVVLGIIGGEE